MRRSNNDQTGNAEALDNIMEETKHKELQDYQKGYVKLVAILLFLVVWMLVSKNIGRIVEVSGSSMNDYVYDGGFCAVKTGKYEINRYDVVLAKMDYQTVIKRVIGLPLDRILIRDGVVYVNGTKCEEYDLYTEYAGIASQEIVLQENEYFLLGDNRSESYDSRDYGAFSREKIKGHVVKILWKGRK